MKLRYFHYVFTNKVQTFSLEKLLSYFETRKKWQFFLTFLRKSCVLFKLQVQASFFALFMRFFFPGKIKHLSFCSKFSLFLFHKYFFQKRLENIYNFFSFGGRFFGWVVVAVGSIQTLHWRKKCQTIFRVLS